MNILKLAGIF